MRKSSYYRSCPDCGANLDPGEHCDCGEEKELIALGFDLAHGSDKTCLCDIGPRVNCTHSNEGAKNQLLYIF